jgi:hypothetical protein
MASRAVSYRGDSAPLAWLASGAVVLAFASGCRDHGSSDQATRPLPAPEPSVPAAAAALPREDEASRPKKRSGEDADTVAKPKRPAGDTEGQPVLGEPTPAAGEVAAPAAVTAAPSADTPAVPSSNPGVVAPSAACIARCQGAMQGCLSTPVDGGVPGFGNLELCKKAFEACQSACSKQ